MKANGCEYGRNVRKGVYRNGCTPFCKVNSCKVFKTKGKEAKEGKTQKNQEIISRITFFGCTPLIRFTVRPF